MLSKFIVLPMRSEISDLHSISMLHSFPLLHNWDLCAQVSYYEYKVIRFIMGMDLIVYECKKEICHEWEEHMHPYLLRSPVVQWKCHINCINGTETVLYMISLLIQVYYTPASMSIMSGNTAFFPIMKYDSSLLYDITSIASYFIINISEVYKFNIINIIEMNKT